MAKIPDYDKDFHPAKRGENPIWLGGMKYVRDDEAEARADRAAQEARALALQEVAKVMGEYHWNRYASREEGGELYRPAVFTSHTHQQAQELILALMDSTHAEALERVRAEEREACAKIADAREQKNENAAMSASHVNARSAILNRAGEAGAIAAAIRARGET